MQLINGCKMGMTVTFKDKNKHEVTNYHEVESLDEKEIEKQLQMSADEFASRDWDDVIVPEMTEDKDVSVALKEPVII